jgi:hypothetical protein
MHIEPPICFELNEIPFFERHTSQKLDSEPLQVLALPRASAVSRGGGGPR